MADRDPRAELLDHLTAERYDNGWWKTPPSNGTDPASDALYAFGRLRALAEDFDQFNRDHPPPSTERRRERETEAVEW